MEFDCEPWRGDPGWKGGEAGTAGYSFTIKLLLQSMEADSGRVWSAKQGVEMDLWIWRINTFLILNNERKGEALIPISGGWFLITVIACLRQCRHNEFKFVSPGRSPNLFMMVTGIGCSSLCACPRPHGFVYFLTVVNKRLASAPYIEEVKVTPLSVFSGHGGLQRRVQSGTTLAD